MLEYNKYRKIAYDKKTKKAVALAYDHEQDNAPVVVASGAGYVAERIIEIADKANIPIYRDETAAGLLAQLQLGQEIPYELYEVIAEIFGYILKTTKNLR